MPVAAANAPGGLNAFQNALMGNWTNVALPGAPNGEGGQDNPLSYNVMPLPQDSSPTGYILKNSTVWENLRFNKDVAGIVAIPTTAANRGTTVSQAPTALYYEQQVFFGQGPGKGSVVHTENGSWLNLQTIDPMVGPYGTPVGSNPVFTKPNGQPSTVTVAKQMSVPHGNSVLALGSFTDNVAGAPVIPDTDPTTPSPPGLDTTPYTTAMPPATTPNDHSDYQNPLPEYTANPNKPLQQAVAMLDVTNHITWTVTTKQITGAKGSTVNIPFEQRSARVVDYTATYWLMATNAKDYTYLAYVQWVDLQIPIDGKGPGGGPKTFTFPHVTSNVVTKTTA